MDYIYGKLCQRVKEVQYSGGTTDTIQVNVNNDTNVITADYLGGQPDVTKEYVDQQIAGLSTRYLSLNGGTMNGDIVLPHGVDELDNEYSHSIILRNDNDVAGDIKLDYNGIKYTDNMYNNFVFDIGEVRIGGTNMESDGTQSGYITVNQNNTLGIPVFGAVNSETTSFSKYLDSGGPLTDAYYSDLHSTKDMLITTTGNSVSFKKYSNDLQTGPQLNDVRLSGIATPVNDNDAVNKKYVDDNASSTTKMYRHIINAKSDSYATSYERIEILSSSSELFTIDSLATFLINNNCTTSTFTEPIKYFPCSGANINQNIICPGIFYRDSSDSSLQGVYNYGVQLVQGSLTTNHWKIISITDTVVEI